MCGAFQLQVQASKPKEVKVAPSALVVEAPAAVAVDPKIELEKKIRAIKKKLRQIDELIVCQNMVQFDCLSESFFLRRNRPKAKLSEPIRFQPEHFFLPLYTHGHSGRKGGHQAVIG